MPLFGEEDVFDLSAPLLDRVDDRLGLLGRHDLVLPTLQDDHRALDPVDVLDRRPVPVDLGDLSYGVSEHPRGVRGGTDLVDATTDEAVEVSAFELVGVAGEQALPFALSSVSSRRGKDRTRSETPYELPPAPKTSLWAHNAASTVYPPADPPMMATFPESVLPDSWRYSAHATVSATSTMPQLPSSRCRNSRPKPVEPPSVARGQTPAARVERWRDSQLTSTKAKPREVQYWISQSRPGGAADVGPPEHHRETSSKAFARLGAP